MAESYDKGPKTGLDALPLLQTFPCQHVFFSCQSSLEMSSVSAHFAAQIESAPLITLESGRWQGNAFLAQSAVTANRNN